MPVSDETKRAQNRERVRRHRERKKQTDIPFDSALARQAMGEAIPEHLLAQPAPWRPSAEDIVNASDPRGIPGQREYVSTQYGSEARIRAQRELASREVVDTTRPSEVEPKESIRERVLRSLPNSIRRDAAQREQAIRRAEAEAAGELVHPGPPDFRWLTETEERSQDPRAWEREQARRTDQQDRASEDEPYRFAARFTHDWDEGNTESIDAPEGFRR